MKLTSMALFATIFGVILVGFFAVGNELGADDAMDITIDNSIQTKFEPYINETYYDTKDASDAIENITSDKTAQFFTGTWNALSVGLKLIKNSLGIVIAIVTEIATIIHLPSEIVALLGGILVLISIAYIVKIILKVE